LLGQQTEGAEVDGAISHAAILVSCRQQ
jgi:hypothetical protein